jgi:hypothetical protein
VEPSYDVGSRLVDADQAPDRLTAAAPGRPGTG